MIVAVIVFFSVVDFYLGGLDSTRQPLLSTLHSPFSTLSVGLSHLDKRLMSSVRGQRPKDMHVPLNGCGVGHVEKLPPHNVSPLITGQVKSWIVHEEGQIIWAVSDHKHKM